MINVTKVKKCRVCNNTDLVPVIDLGSQYLSSVFPENLAYRKKAEKYPLDLVLCKKTKDTCGALQLAHFINLDSMYELYPYSSSTNSSMVGILKDVVDSAIPLVQLERDDLILDIGGNDGTLLSFFAKEKLDLLTIDPAQKIKQVFKSNRYRYICDFFNKKTFEKATNKKAKLIFSIAMFYHLSDPISFSKEVRSALADDGVWVIQMAYLPTMITTNMYDNIVHEHAGYYTATNMVWIMERAGLEVFDVMLNDVYGGSFRIFVKKTSNTKLKTTKRLRKILDDEKKQKLTNTKTYTDFMNRIEKTKTDLKKLIAKIKKQNKSIWIYGASTKGSTILQFCDITNKDIVAAADSNPFKFGKYIIGADIPIKDEKALRKAKPDYLLALPYSFVDGFISREKELVKNGTKFIVPLPRVKVIPK
jgi:hypothetical protein